MTPNEFALFYMPTAHSVSVGTGIDPTVLLAQWAVETAWGSQQFNLNNPGNIRCLQSVPCVNGFAQFPSYDSFIQNCIAVWHNGLYDPVLVASDPITQMIAICQSKWSAEHYGFPSVNDLQDAWEVLVMTTLDDLMKWISDLRYTQSAEVGTSNTGSGGTAPGVLPATLPEILAAVKAINTAIDNTVVLTALAKLQNDVTEIRMRVDKDLAPPA